MSRIARAVDTGWCTFQLADGLYGVELSRVNEVLRPQPLARVPLAPPAVAGLLNLRGHIVPAVDLRTLFGLKPRSAGALVVVHADDGPVALVVDAIGDVQRRAMLPPGALEADTHAAHDSLCAQTIPLPESLLVVIDLDRVLQQAFDRPEPAGIARSRAWAATDFGE